MKVTVTHKAPVPPIDKVIIELCMEDAVLLLGALERRGQLLSNLHHELAKALREAGAV